MKKLNLLMMLFAMLLTACSDSDNENGVNGGGGTGNNKGNIVGLNIKDAKLIYGVERSTSVKSMLKSNNPYAPHYFRQITTRDENMPVNWVKENGDTTSVIYIDAIAKLTNDYLLVTTQNYLTDPGLCSIEIGGYIVNKSTGKIINPENRFTVKNYSDGYDNFASYYDGERYCYITTSYSGIEKNIVRIDFKTSETKKMLEECDDVKMFSNGSFFAHMINGKHKYGSLLFGEIKEFSDMERYKGWDNYIPVDGVVDGVLSIICNKKNTDGTTTYAVIDYYAGDGYGDYGFADQFDNPNYRFISDFELKPNIPLGAIYLVPVSVNTSRTSQMIYIGTSNGKQGIVINRNINGLSQLSNDLIDGFIAGTEYSSYESIYPNIAVNSVAAFNLKKDYSGDLIITDFETLTQKTIKEAKGFNIKGVIGKHSDNRPITFIGNKLEQVENNGWWRCVKQCIGTIDSKGNAEILQEFNPDDNESMTGFLMELN